MSLYNLIGIDHESKLQSLKCGDDIEPLMAYAQKAASRYRQLFLVSQGHNVRELKVKVELGDYAPLVKQIVPEG